ncbi:cytochrome b5 [Macrolepiota fuliginosa MF-IS2]|uniref:Cytochrome b5 n=1 Tax=Macrolepiota fuliginosa MF-IS2 TaxID=1400762 RepID=A0A9P5XJD3_9AGAR|nr:cytochrome b5 [Macrolepiota fuliginosa MF-IS2]
MAGGDSVPPYVESDSSNPKVKDPAIPNRMVSTKSANRPFLAHREYREKQEALHNEWVKKKQERDEKIARGEKVGPLEPDPTAVEEVGLLGFLKFIVYLLLIVTLAGKFVTGSFLWESESKWLQLRTYLPKNERLFSETMLAQFDGSDPDKPIYLAFDGEVFDVTKGRAYQPGGSYHHFAGADAARAFATGCFKDHKTHDLRGLSEAELKSIEHWRSFYREHKDYHKIGRVSHKPIDPSSPIPVHCDPKKAEKQRQERAEREKAAAQKTEDKHEEL